MKIQESDSVNIYSSYKVQRIRLFLSTGLLVAFAALGVQTLVCKNFVFQKGVCASNHIILPCGNEIRADILHQASRDGDEARINAMFAFFPEHAELLLNIYDQLGETPLIIAVKNNNLPIVKRLLELGADINTGDYRKDTALHWAGWLGLSEIVDLLVQWSPDFTVRNFRGLTPAQEAAMNPVGKECARIIQKAQVA